MDGPWRVETVGRRRRVPSCQLASKPGGLGRFRKRARHSLRDEQHAEKELATVGDGARPIRYQCVGLDRLTALAHGVVLSRCVCSVEPPLACDA